MYQNNYYYKYLKYKSKYLELKSTNLIGGGNTKTYYVNMGKQLVV